MLVATIAFAAATIPAAGDQAVLRNGFSIRHHRRQALGNVTRLFLSEGGGDFVDVPSEQIAAIEVEEEAATPLNKSNSAGGKSAPIPDLAQIVNQASDDHLLDADLIHSVIAAESNFKVNAVSRKGAQGLMQLMPGTAKKLGVADSFDARANVQAGTRYLRALLEEFDYDLVKALAAYNSGPRRVRQYQGVPPYPETRSYVSRIVRDFNHKKMAERVAARRTIASTPSANKKQSGTVTSNANEASPHTADDALAVARKTAEPDPKLLFESHKSSISYQPDE